MSRVLVVATSRKTRGGITSVVKAHETGPQWKQYHCHWIQTHRDGPSWRKILYLLWAWIDFLFRLPMTNLVHIHGTGGSSGKRKLLFVKVAKIFRKKIIFHFHPSGESVLLENRSQNILKKIFSNSDLIIVLSPNWERLIMQIFPNNSFKIKVLMNPCPIVKRDDRIKKSQILYAGTIIKRKGYDILIKAFGRIAHNHQNWKLVFAGNPYLLEGYNEIEEGVKIANQLKISDQIEWIGWVNGHKKDKVFNESSIYCLASESEGFPMGVLDAWAYGLPCVMTPVGGLPDIVEDGKTGLFFPVGDEIELAKKLEDLIKDENLRKIIVCRTDEWVNGMLSVKEINNQLSDIYAKLLR